MPKSSYIPITEAKYAGIETHELYHQGRSDSPLVLYHPGLYGTLKQVRRQNLPRLALESGCSFLALNTIDQDPSNYPNTPKDFDFLKCAQMLEEAIEEKLNDAQGVITILNCWGTFPMTLALDKLQIELESLVSIGGTLNADKIYRGILEGYFRDGVLTKEEEQRFHDGGSVNLPYPNAESKFRTDIRKAYFDAIDAIDTSHLSVPVRGQRIFIRSKQDVHATEADTNQLKRIFTGEVEPEDVNPDGHHWTNKRVDVERAFISILGSTPI